MIRITYDEKGRVSGLPNSISQSGNETFEVYADHLTLSADDDLSLRLAFPQPVGVGNGTYTLGYAGDSTAPIKSNECTPFAIELMLNRLASVISTGGVRAYNDVISFNEPGARTGFTVSHSILGDLSGRCITVISGGISASAVYRLDLSAQTLTEDIAPTDTVTGAVTVEQVTAGSVAEIHRDRITINRPPKYGKMRISDGVNLSEWLPANASSYQLEMAMEVQNVIGFMVSKSVSGESVIFDVARDAVGVNDSITVEHTFGWSGGVSFAMTLSDIANILAAIGYSGPVSAILSLTRNGESQFEQAVRLDPLLQAAGPII